MTHVVPEALYGLFYNFNLHEKHIGLPFGSTIVYVCHK